MNVLLVVAQLLLALFAWIGGFWISIHWMGLAQVSRSRTVAVASIVFIGAVGIMVPIGLAVVFFLSMFDDLVEDYITIDRGPIPLIVTLALLGWMATAVVAQAVEVHWRVSLRILMLPSAFLFVMATIFYFFNLLASKS